MSSPSEKYIVNEESRAVGIILRDDPKEILWIVEDQCYCLRITDTGLLFFIFTEGVRENMVFRSNFSFLIRHETYDSLLL